MECPNCGSSTVQKKGKRSNKQKYRCTKCGASFTEGVSYKKQVKLPPLTGVLCPECKSTHIIRDGKLEDGSQRYRCRSCNSEFSTKTVISEIPKKRRKLLHLTPLQRETLIRAVLAGKNVHKLTVQFNCTRDYIRRLLKPYYDKEAITIEQKKDIIRYGYHLRVPVDYMAEYIKCSEHKCEEVLKKFKKSLRSTTHGAI